MKMNYKMWKTAFPFKCSMCGYKHDIKREYCESCGTFDVLIETNKKDYKYQKK